MYIYTHKLIIIKKMFASLFFFPVKKIYKNELNCLLGYVQFLMQHARKFKSGKRKKIITWEMKNCRTRNLRPNFIVIFCLDIPNQN